MTVIDTCSLLNLVKFYLPFDDNQTLIGFLQSQIEAKEIVVIDQVYKQCGWVLGGLVTEKMPFLKEHKVDTSAYLPDKDFFHLLNTDFKENKECKKLTPKEFEEVRTSFSEDADAKMLLYCLKHKNDYPIVRLLTDETGKNNDSKCFKKLPTLCDILGINCLDLPTYLKEQGLIQVGK